ERVALVRDERDDGVARRAVDSHAGHRGTSGFHPGVAGEKILEVVRVEVLPRGEQDFARAAGDDELAADARPEVAGVEPAGAIDRLSRERLVAVIALRDVVATDEHVADDAVRECRTARIGDRELATRDRRYDLDELDALRGVGIELGGRIADGERPARETHAAHRRTRG